VAKPRYSQISLEETPWYHVVSRCVRRAYLCGVDGVTGASYEHRRGWVEQRLRKLASIFTIDIAAYAIMHNHYHIVLRIEQQQAAELSVEEVIQRWSQLYKGPMLMQRYLSDQREQMNEWELEQVAKLAEEYRQRLSDLSWFMRNLNEYISRKANAEDKAKGHFWESRYKCQALLDEQALLAAMAYVDLNPVRAAMAETPEESPHTSIKLRLQELLGTESDSEATPAHTDEQYSVNHGNEPLAQVPCASLLDFATDDNALSIPFTLPDYLELLDSVGRAVHPDKKGSIPEHSPAILHRLGINITSFIKHSNQFFDHFGDSVGSAPRMMRLAAVRNVRYLRGVVKARMVFGG